MDELNFIEGRLSFWIPRGTIEYGDNKFVYLFNYFSKKGYLKIVKNKANGLEVHYMFNGFGYCKLVEIAEDLNNEERHDIEVSWSINEGLVKLYIDGIERQSCEINLGVPSLNNSI